MIKCYHRTDYETFVRFIKEAPEAKKHKGNNGSMRKKHYKDLICAFDIETSRIEEQTFMYCWAFAAHDRVVTGRTWSDFTMLMNDIDEMLEDSGQQLICFVHNLSYEWQFIRSLYNFQTEDVFLMDSRKPLYVRWGNIEIRCSFRLTNMSLDKFTSSLGSLFHKKSGELFDYSKIRYPDTPLSSREWLYQIYDVVGLVDSIEIKMDLDGDSIYTLPYTSTGYVRRDCKKAMRSFSRTSLKRIIPTYEVFLALREAFRGGNVHANRWFAGEIQEDEDMASEDKGSSYPTQCFEKLPMGPWSYTAEPTLSYILSQMDRGRAVLMRVRMWDVRLKDRSWGCPYIPIAKCRNLYESVNDNGRVLDAKMLEITITDIDLEILLAEYDFDIEILECWTARYGYLPKELRDVVMYYFKGKTELKGVAGMEYEYAQRKAKLNSIYGMMVTNMLRPKIKYVDGEEVLEPATKEDYEEVCKKAFLSYGWGVWITARSRADLERAIRFAHENGTFLYADTDSVKYKGDLDWSDFNKRYIKTATKNGTYAYDVKGRIHYLGEWEFDGAYDRFITLGAKKYGSVRNGKLKITIAGVNPKEGAKELKKLENFKEGFKFTSKSAGLCAKYFDDVPVHASELNGHRIEWTPYVSLVPVDYTLGITNEYRKLLSDPEWYLDGFDGKCY